ncbi:MAG: HypC/HybG/HupF family hydrogenase formation chaperone [Candidatus Methanomethylicia archaeon]
MCLSFPAKVVQIDDMVVFVDYGNNHIEPVINSSGQELKEGDYVVVSYGMIISKISEDEFKEMINYELELKRVVEDSNQFF